VESQSDLTGSTGGRAIVARREVLRCFLVGRSRVFHPRARSFLRTAAEFLSLSVRVVVSLTGLGDDEEGGVDLCRGPVEIPADGWVGAGPF
jgi:hypothetical protein